MSTITTSVFCKSNNRNNVCCRCQQTADNDVAADFDFDARFGVGSKIVKNCVEHQHRKNGTNHVIVEQNDNDGSTSFIVHGDLVEQNDNMISTSFIHQICPFINVLSLVNLLDLIN